MEQKTGKQGALVMWCSSCERFIAYPSGRFFGTCRRCGDTMVKRKCTRCGHEWIPQSRSSVAKKCPKCKSPYWNRQRMDGKEAEPWEI